MLPIYLENVGQVSQVERVVELDGRGQEAVIQLVVQSDGGLNHGGSTSLNRRAEELLLQVTLEDLAEDGPLSLERRKVHGKHREMSLCQGRRHRTVRH